MSYPPTAEQQAAIDAFYAGQHIALEAGAGTGKTSTLRFLAAAVPMYRGIYMAYNNSVAKDAAATFPGNVICKTGHGHTMRINDVQRARLFDMPAQYGGEVARILGIRGPHRITEHVVYAPRQVARIAMETVTRFARSGDTDIQPKHVPTQVRLESGPDKLALSEQVLPYARAAWEDILAPGGYLKWNHDFYRKVFQLEGHRLPGDFLFLDEAQDCQPSGTLVSVPAVVTTGRGRRVSVEQVKIEDLRVGDRVISHGKSRVRMRGSIITSIGSRDHDGELVAVTTASGLVSRYTPEHICIAKVGPAFHGRTILYLMRRGTSFRVGITSARYGQGVHGSSGFAGRMLHEQGDAIWVLDVFDHRHDALMAEAEASVRYGIPGMRFIASGQPSAVGQDRIDAFWQRMGDLTEKAATCLAAFGRMIEHPIARRSHMGVSGARDDYMLYTRAATVRACNLIDGMEVIDAASVYGAQSQMVKRTGDAYSSITVARQPYTGQVWSLEVEGDHTYVADGIVTHNCNGVTIAIVKAHQQAGMKVVAVGDRQQSINGWMGATDAMDAFDGTRLALTKSFRFGPAIAGEANKWLTLLDAPLRITGHEPINSTVLHGGAKFTPDAILTRTNAEAVAQAMKLQATGVKVAIVKGGDEIARLAKSSQELKDTGSTMHPELCAFTSWGQVQEYVEQDHGGSDLAVFVKLIDDYGADTVIRAMDRLAPENKAQVTLSTAHKSKGREWDRVRIAGDFREPKRDDNGRLTMPGRDEMMLAYVAVTRAKQVLDPGGLSWVNELAGASRANRRAS